MEDGLQKCFGSLLGFLLLLSLVHLSQNLFVAFLDLSNASLKLLNFCLEH